MFFLTFLILLLQFSVFGSDVSEPLSTIDELTICSQNLHNLGVRRPGSKRSFKRQKKKIDYLVQRFRNQKCDVIAVQEVGGNSKDEALKALSGLVKNLSNETRVTYVALPGDSNDDYIRNGFIYNGDKLRVSSVDSFTQINLPRLQSLGRIMRFARGPTKARFSFRRKGEANATEVSVFSFHFKSKANGWKDPTRTKFETLRMRSAEALRELGVSEGRRLSANSIVVFAGDLNSFADSATAGILSGRYRLREFEPGSICRLDRQLDTRCEIEPAHQALFAPVLSRNGSSGNSVASYRYKGRLQLIDNLYLGLQPNGSLPTGFASFQSGMEGSFRRGSDHKMPWVRFNW